MAWAIQTGRTDSLDLFKRLSVGDALPLPAGTTQAETVLPIPLSILTEKPKGGDPIVPWWADGAAEPEAFDNLFREKNQEDEKPKRPGAHEYLCQVDANGKWLRYTPTMNVRLRNATPKRNSQGEAELFSLEEIAEETCFQTELRFENPGDVQPFIDAFAPLLRGGDWLAVGRGGMPVVIGSTAGTTDSQQDTDHDDWTLTLISDLIVRGPHLGFLDDLDIDTLCAWAGLARPGGCDWTISKRAVETERVHGFNAVTGLQRAPALALRRGSCWRIIGPGSAALAKALAAKPYLGERTGEGFGRFLIGIQPITAFDKPKGEATTRASRRAEELLSTALELSGKIGKNGPSLSQLQWLREQALAATDLKHVNELLTEIETAPRRRPQGGKAWAEEMFPIGDLKKALRALNNTDKERELKEKKQLLSYLVQWRVPVEKEKRK